jgi:transcriptional regulator of acetoin/glycerol metabolism
MTELSLARRQLDAAWSSYVRDGCVPESVRPELLRSWHRTATDWRIDHELRVPRDSISADDLELRLETDEVFQIASPLLTDFAERLAPDMHIVTFVDRAGVILTVQGNKRSGDEGAQSNFAPGACWSEESAGTNGIGLALIEGRPIEVFASEHYVGAWQSWSCASAPVRSAGRIAGVIDITSPWGARHPSLLVCAEALARAVEARLEAVAAHRCEALREALLRSGDRDASAAIDMNGAFVGIGPTARRAGWDPAFVNAATLAPVLALIGAQGGRRRETEHTIEFGVRSVRVACTPVEHEGRVIGAVLRNASPLAGKAAAGRRRLYRFEDILGAAPSLERQRALGRAAAGNLLPVLVSGESGTGKELFAQAIHSASGRAAGPFVAVNCGSITPSLVEAELFGYEAGTFTGGRKEGKRGRVEDADGGTLFLDEVSELSPSAQTALLRILQEREVTRIGSSTPRAVDFRLVAASNKDLQEEIRARRFRQDLYYRLNVLRIDLPPLRDRREDVPHLAEHVLAIARVELRRDLAFSPDAVAALQRYGWPGNVRELKNVVERAAVSAAGQRIELADLTPEVRERGEALAAAPAAVAVATIAACPHGAGQGLEQEAERVALQRALEDSSWNIVQAARSLGISRSTMYRRLQQHGLVRG